MSYLLLGLTQKYKTLTTGYFFIIATIYSVLTYFT